MADLKDIIQGTNQKDETWRSSVLEIAQNINLELVGIKAGIAGLQHSNDKMVDAIEAIAAPFIAIKDMFTQIGEGVRQGLEEQGHEFGQALQNFAEVMGESFIQKLNVIITTMMMQNRATVTIVGKIANWLTGQQRLSDRDEMRRLREQLSGMETTAEYTRLEGRHRRDEDMPRESLWARLMKAIGMDGGGGGLVGFLRGGGNLISKIFGFVFAGIGTAIVLTGMGLLAALGIVLAVAGLTRLSKAMMEAKEKGLTGDDYWKYVGNALVEDMATFVKGIAKVGVTLALSDNKKISDAKKRIEYESDAIVNFLELFVTDIVNSLTEFGTLIKSFVGEAPIDRNYLNQLETEHQALVVKLNETKRDLEVNANKIRTLKSAIAQAEKDGNTAKAEGLKKMLDDALIERDKLQAIYDKTAEQDRHNRSLEQIEKLGSLPKLMTAFEDYVASLGWFGEFLARTKIEPLKPEDFKWDPKGTLLDKQFWVDLKATVDSWVNWDTKGTIFDKQFWTDLKASVLSIVNWDTSGTLLDKKFWDEVKTAAVAMFWDKLGETKTYISTKANELWTSITGTVDQWYKDIKDWILGFFSMDYWKQKIKSWVGLGEAEAEVAPKMQDRLKMEDRLSAPISHVGQQSIPQLFLPPSTGPLAAPTSPSGLFSMATPNIVDQAQDLVKKATGDLTVKLQQRAPTGAGRRGANVNSPVMLGGDTIVNSSRSVTASYGNPLAGHGAANISHPGNFSS